MDNLDNLPDGIASRLRALEDEDDDEVDHRISAKWGANNASDIFRSESQAPQPASSASKGPAASVSSRSFAQAFEPLKKRLDSYESRDQQRVFSFSSAVRTESDKSDWDTYDPTVQDHSEVLRKSQRRAGQASATGSRMDIYDPRNRALEGTFGSTGVKRVTEENPEFLDLTLPDLDPRLENPDLDIDPNVRANFLPISELHRAPIQRASFAMRNPTLVASNTGGSILTVLGGETIIQPASKPADRRVSQLDRHGKYIGKDLGQIRKSAKRQHRENVWERERQLSQADAEYKALANMSPEERANLLERLRKPYEWEGAFDEDQHDEPHIPEVYTREIPTERVLTWMENDFSQISIAATGSIVPSDPGSALGYRVGSINTQSPLGGFDDVDDFAAGSSFVSTAESASNDQQYVRDALHYDRWRGPHKPASNRSSSAIGTKTLQQFDRRWLSNAGTSPSVTTSSRALDDPFSFDDSPEFQIPTDCAIKSEVHMTPHQDRFYKDATTLSQNHGRVVLVHLHQLVKFSPGAIATRVFGGSIQAMQLFPVQRIAIVIFLHPSEARAFVRHVKHVRGSGRQEHIRQLQIEAGWYKGIEKPDSVLPVHPNILAHHIASEATRCLRLHHLSPTKTREAVSSELGRRLAMPLLGLILCPPRLDNFRSGRDGQSVRDARLDRDAPLGSAARLGRQAIVEFVSISDAISARKALMAGEVEEYEDCQPVFASDPSALLGVERDYCSCAGCRYQRKQRVARRVLRRGGESDDDDN